MQHTLIVLMCIHKRMCVYHVRMYNTIGIYVRTYMLYNIRIYVCAYIRTYIVYLYVYIHHIRTYNICMRVCMYACIYVHIYTAHCLLPMRTPIN